MIKRRILLIISLAFLVGGIGRLVASEGVFRIFQMEHLWLGEPFFIYTYKLLGVFVIWIGIILFVCSKDVIKYRSVIIGSILALLLFFVVSLLTGFITGLGVQFFLVDSIFSLILIVLLYFIQKE
ncbi:MAG: hypothetical protein KAW02_05865 [candidate division Zixibacteria bacterium]|nr:hypothetical protein [candidate division Zixibacteria bacterium]